MSTGLPPIKQGFVRALRDITALKAAVGSDGIAEGFAPRGKDYPFCVYTVVYANRLHDWTGMHIRALFDVFIVSDDQVEAHNLDQLVIAGLHDKVLDLEVGTSGQTNLLCRRTADLSLVDLDDAGEKVFQIGGSYSIWTDQVTA